MQNGWDTDKTRATPIWNCPYTLLYIVAAKNRNHSC